MAANLLRAGYGLTVHDLRPEAAAELLELGAAWAATPAEVARASRITFIALPGPAEVEATALGKDGLVSGWSVGDVVIDLSTSSPNAIRRIAAVAAADGVEVLDAPLSGGVRGARKATLVIMVGGATTAFEACEPVLRVLGDRVFHMGDLGSGYVTKLVNNYMGMSNALASMEAVVLGVRAGVDAQKLLDVVNEGTGSSHMTRTLFPFLIMKRNFEPARFSMELAAKDFDLALDLASEFGLPMRIGASARGALGEAIADGLGQKDMSAYVTVLEAAAGVEIRGPDADG
jgi:3-hydroxyisobutyrate dehydrogenase-like beta-hydroxyacid dehydrogenase